MKDTTGIKYYHSEIILIARHYTDLLIYSIRAGAIQY